MEKSTKYSLVDAHIHLSRYKDKDIDHLAQSKKYVFLAVSEDLQSSLRILKLSKLYEFVIPAIGIHPWNVENVTRDTLEAFKKLVSKENIGVLGEIGLDKKFVPQTYEKQKDIFEFFLDLAREYDLAVNLHTPETWDEVYNLLLKYDIKKAYFHWYTGPKELLREIQEQGYFIGINVALRWQEKHREILEEAQIENIITESDGPYVYKGHQLSPELLEDLVETISKINGLESEKVCKTLKQNLAKLIT
jgi:TatD DNase family protein